MSRLFNCWRQAASGGKTTLEAADETQALDRFCQRHGFANHAGYLRYHQRTTSDLVVEPVQ